MSYAGVLKGVRWFTSATSLADSDRACLTYSTAGFRATAGRSAELEILWTGSTGTTLPWLLRPLHWLSPRRSLALVKNPLAIQRIAELWLAVGPGSERVEFCSVRRSAVEALVGYMQRGGIDPDDFLLAAEASRALLSIEAGSEYRSCWWVEVQYGLECPADLMHILEAGEDEWEADT